MKNILKSFVLLFALTSLVSCEDESDKLILEAKNDPSFRIITPADGEGVVLVEATPNNAALTLNWAPAQYSVTTAVTYEVQIAKVNTDFAVPFTLSSITNGATNTVITMGQLNTPALLCGGVPFVSTPIEVRIKASVAGTQEQYTSPIIFNVTAYGCLSQYLVGSGVPDAGWGWSTPVSMICDNNILTVRTTFANNGIDSFRIFTENGNWNSGRNYPFYTNNGYKISSVLVNANDGDQNFKFNGATGVHKIIVNEVNKSISIGRSSVVSGIEPLSHWLVGAATPGGWSWAGNNESECRLINTGVYESIIQMNNGETFRLWTANNGGDSWGEENRNYSWYVTNGYTIDSELINGLDGDSNFRYVGPTAVRRIIFDNVNKVITVD